MFNLDAPIGTQLWDNDSVRWTKESDTVWVNDGGEERRDDRMVLFAPLYDLTDHGKFGIAPPAKDVTLLYDRLGQRWYLSRMTGNWEGYHGRMRWQDIIYRYGPISDTPPEFNVGDPLCLWAFRDLPEGSVAVDNLGDAYITSGRAVFVTGREDSLTVDDLHEIVYLVHKEK